MENKQNEFKLTLNKKMVTILEKDTMINFQGKNNLNNTKGGTRNTPDTCCMCTSAVDCDTSDETFMIRL